MSTKLTSVALQKKSLKEHEPSYGYMYNGYDISLVLIFNLINRRSTVAKLSWIELFGAFIELSEVNVHNNLKSHTKLQTHKNEVQWNCLYDWR